jgi:hypothetical protein
VPAPSSGRWRGLSGWAANWPGLCGGGLRGAVSAWPGLRGVLAWAAWRRRGLGGAAD